MEKSAVMNDIVIRQERPQEYREVEWVIREAFWDVYQPGADEHYLAHILRDSADFIPELDLVAEVDGKIVGNIMYTRSWIEREGGGRVETVTFGPVGVLPEYHRKGIGGQLIRRSAKMARDMGFPAILIHGDPDYYRRLGFVSAKQLGIANREGTYPMAHQILQLAPDALQGISGRAYESQAMEIDPHAAADFDGGFSPKEKRKTQSQEKFIRISQTYL